MTAAAIASSTEAGVLVANHLATVRSLPKEVRTITNGGNQHPAITIPTREARTRYSARSVRVTLSDPPSSLGTRCYWWPINCSDKGSGRTPASHLLHYNT
ncbi:hypothetical protein AVEN_188839-1 [Araneus ventricosus]|uniref:Uncharacterized protein n=1 Tax=Araneus ventricosus TaxID=182803 RepID=A0A4Y2BUZ6_ARAVE|nr:hypothetical protein AVEN_188839-1 [Araneus ventricosus]